MARQSRREKRAHKSRYRRLWLEFLEDRTLPSTYHVLNTLNSGLGSLRQALLDANAHAGTDTIQFSIGAGVQVIMPLSALPAITYSRKGDFRLIRPLVYVTVDATRAFAQSLGAPVIPCGCSQKAGTVRRSLRDMLAEIEKDHPFLKETLLSALGNVQPSRLLDTRYIDLEGTDEESSFLPEPELVSIRS